MQTATAEPVAEHLFSDAKSAIRFAVTRIGGPSRPSLAYMMGNTTVMAGPSKGLGGLNGVAQAGLIFSALRDLPMVSRAVLIAGSAPKVVICYCKRPCCSGKHMSPEWATAVQVLADGAMTGALCRAHNRIRSAIILSIYGMRQSYAEMSRSLQVDQEVVSKHYKAVYRWLFGTKGENAVQGLDPFTWNEAENILRDAGIVGG